MTSGEEVLEVSEMVIFEPQPGNSVPEPRSEGILLKASTTTDAYDVYDETEAMKSEGPIMEMVPSQDDDILGSNMLSYQPLNTTGDNEQTTQPQRARLAPRQDNHSQQRHTTRNRSDQTGDKLKSFFESFNLPSSGRPCLPERVIIRPVRQLHSARSQGKAPVRARARGGPTVSNTLLSDSD
mgnify:CR=1 FL=1